MPNIEKIKMLNRLTPHFKAAAQLVRTTSLLKISMSNKKQSGYSKNTSMPLLFNEKRQVEARVPAQIAVRYRAIKGENETEAVFDHHDEVKVSFSKNVSSGGIFLVTKEELDFESLLHLHIFLPHTPQFISVLARVMWTDQEGAGLCFVGMKQAEVERLKEQIEKIKKD
jgi:Tfp pilus assembly protein PilZ